MVDRQLLARLDAQDEVTLVGCGGSHLAWVLARLARARGPVVVVTRDADNARQLAADLAFFLGGGTSDPSLELPAVMLLPEVETSPYAETSSDRAGVQARMGVLYRLSAGLAGEALVCSASALRSRVIPRETFVALREPLRVGGEIDRDLLAQRLVEAGFGHARIVDDPATFAVRGGIVDLFLPLARFPMRIELFGDRIESIRLFDPSSQRALRAVDALEIHPVRETVRSPLTDVRERVLAAADAAHFPSRATKALLDEIASGRDFFGIEALTPAFHDGLVPLTDYLPAETLWVLVDPEGIAATLEAEDRRDAAAHHERLQAGRLAFAPRDFFVDAPQLAALFDSSSRVLVPAHDVAPGSEQAVVRAGAAGHAELVAELRRARAERGEEILKTVAERLQRWAEQGARVVLAAGGVAQAERLDAMLRAHDIEPQLRRDAGTPYLLEGEGGPAATSPVVQAGALSAGFELAGDLVLLSDHELFGPRARKPRPSRRGVGPGIGDLRQLRPGQAVVHTLHGIGVYRGLSKLEVSGVAADFLLLEYAGGDRLYLPVYRMDQVERYVASDAPTPKLDRLGGVTWQRKRTKVALEVRRFGEELLQLYAEREALAGHAFASPGGDYQEFAATFPYSETDDQLKAIDEVLADLTSERPMDRLVCGDVGFGKTEVALRGAFIAAMAGKQVAVLAPTTVLVEQHQRTFRERLEPYALRVESLSRFRKPAEVRDVLAGLAAGRVDVVVGTHRLLSSDVGFNDLGLLVVDEEQRFGVAHKERLKRMRTKVDVLTMTATPIPRTLQMGMVGLREISIIATPPADRLAVRTFVCRYEDGTVAQGIQRELDRGGQVFFVHNRVETIDHWARRVAALVPGARVAVGHGQMDSRRLERVMLDFVAGKYDVLVCTTIIESGLDIPRANTMFVNRADCFGLAQLYQLRGRIGRSSQRAFCFLLAPGLEAISGEARQRLETLQQFTQLGSGFSVASHDLEIRGAGDLLGRRQSGQIAAVGFETYARLLRDAVAELKGEPIHHESDPEINVAVAAYIPDEYVEDVGQRLELYQRLSSVAADEQAVLDILAEIQDRYGPRPDEVDALGALMVVKGIAARLAARVLDLTPKRLALTLDEATPIDPAAVTRLVATRGSRFRLVPIGAAGQSGQARLSCALSAQEQREPLAAAKKILHDLLAHANQTH